MVNYLPQAHGITVKKAYGQHFLRREDVAFHAVESVVLTPNSSVMEIGCGDGFLTRVILQQPLARLWVFEIDHEWATFVRKNLPDPRLTIHEQNILELDAATIAPYQPWTLIANLPYQITFPIFKLLREHRALFAEGVVMIQEEVAQKLVKTHGRDYGFQSLYYQHVFEMKLLDKVPPEAFYPPPKVFSRLLYFKPKAQPVAIPDEEGFWKFVHMCFKQPRRTLKNNLAQSHIDLSKISEATLALRAQQMVMDDFLKLWDVVR